MICGGLLRSRAPLKLRELRDTTAGGRYEGFKIARKPSREVRRSGGAVEIGGAGVMQRVGAAGGPGPIGFQGPPRSLKISPVNIQDEPSDPTQSEYRENAPSARSLDDGRAGRTYFCLFRGLSVISARCAFVPKLPPVFCKTPRTICRDILDVLIIVRERERDANCTFELRNCLAYESANTVRIQSETRARSISGRNHVQGHPTYGRLPDYPREQSEGKAATLRCTVNGVKVTGKISYAWLTSESA